MQNHTFRSQVLIAALVCGCAAPAGEGLSTDEPSTATTAATDEPGTTGTGVTPTTGADTTGGLDFEQCDPWLQDCPAGYKCMAYAPEGEPKFTGNRCTPVVDDPRAAGDSCQVEGGWWTGIDDCDYGHACWDINHETNEGICRPLCTGSEDDHSCPDQAQVCSFWTPGIAHICLETCDPLIQDCKTGLTCAPNWSNGAQQFVCMAEYSGDEGQEFDPCMASNVCDPGLLCWVSTLAMECDHDVEGCCLSLCALDNPQCNGVGAECLPFYDLIGGQAPPEHANVGLCGLPA